MVSEKVNVGHNHKPSVSRKNGLTIMGFLLFLTGAVLVTLGTIEVLKHIDEYQTGLFLLGGLVLFKAGHSILKHCATLRVKRERRNHLLL